MQRFCTQDKQLSEQTKTETSSGPGRRGRRNTGRGGTHFTLVHHFPSHYQTGNIFTSSSPNKLNLTRIIPLTSFRLCHTVQIIRPLQFSYFFLNFHFKFLGNKVRTSVMAAEMIRLSVNTLDCCEHHPLKQIHGHKPCACVCVCSDSKCFNSLHVVDVCPTLSVADYNSL